MTRLRTYQAEADTKGAVVSGRIQRLTLNPPAVDESRRNFSWPFGQATTYRKEIWRRGAAVTSCYVRHSLWRQGTCTRRGTTNTSYPAGMIDYKCDTNADVSSTRILSFSLLPYFTGTMIGD